MATKVAVIPVLAKAMEDRMHATKVVLGQVLAKVATVDKDQVGKGAMGPVEDWATKMVLDRAQATETKWVATKADVRQDRAKADRVEADTAEAVVLGWGREDRVATRGALHRVLARVERLETTRGGAVRVRARAAKRVIRNQEARAADMYPAEHEATTVASVRDQAKAA